MGEEFARLLGAFDTVLASGIHVVITAHAKMRKFEQPDEMGAYDRWEMKLSNGALEEAREFLLGLGIDMDEILQESDTLDRLETLREVYNTIVDKDEQKEKFNVIVNTLVNLYGSSKPEIFKYDWPHKEEYAVLCYLHGLFHNLIDDEKITRARLKMSALLDNSVQATKLVRKSRKILPSGYDKEIFMQKTDMLMAHFTDMAVQGYGWVSL